ncbi:MAG TPA: 50S ribosomal protein L25 [Myxococcales bacterium]|nr:50S ribosomal protein L25 [Myxococcales bacterium]
MAQDTSTLQAQMRDKSGKGPARRLRAKGLVPAICYGPFDKKPLMVAVDPEALAQAIATPHKFNTVIKLEVAGSEPRTVLFKDFEKDPVDGHVLHVDFLEVRLDQDVVVNVPVVLIGKPVGVTEGGILQQVSRTLPVICKPAQIPEKIEVDVSNLKIAESIHISDIKAPDGVRFKTNVIKNATIAVVNIPEKEEVAPAPAAAVPGAEGAAAAAVPGAPGAAAPGAPGAAPGAPGAAPGTPGAAPGAPGAAPGAPARGGADKGAKK